MIIKITPPYYLYSFVLISSVALGLFLGWFFETWISVLIAAPAGYTLGYTEAYLYFKFFPDHIKYFHVRDKKDGRHLHPAAKWHDYLRSLGPKQKTWWKRRN